jgi:uncharacterized membrane protein YoaK (UPF0700 family)
MLITQGPQRDALIDQKLAVTLASIAGGINAAAFYAVGFFSANMTGNVSALSDHLATGNLSGAWLYLAMIVAFVAGAGFCATLLIQGERLGVIGTHAYVVLFEGLLLALVVLIDIFSSATLRIPLLVIGLAFLMGLQNAVVTHLSSARVRTTHISGMATDLGIEMALAWHLRDQRNQNTDANNTRLRLHLTTMLAFLVGGVGGVLLYAYIGSFAFLIASIILCIFGLRGILLARQRFPSAG